ncbi:uncharacterized protein LOC136075760 [Hydra vulgaris]|uniref:Uncharacterized protein LOC136075760 n=1 Tax=Hydra vulgaris TaxID=6087 RepID=A0ABM4B8R7_HYDVU
MTDIYDLYEEPIIDERTEKYQIAIDQTGFCTLPSKSFIVVEGRLLKSDGIAYSAADLITLTNNGIMHLFDRITHQLSGNEVESVAQPGRATTMLRLLNYPNTIQTSKGLSELWFKDTIQNPTTAGKFSIRIPLKHIFGFCDDYNKVIYGLTQTFVLYRSSDNNAIFRANTAAAGKVDVQKITYYIPHVEPSFAQMDILLKGIVSRQNIKAAFRDRRFNSIAVPQTTSFSWDLGARPSSEVPRYVIVRFQTNKDGDQTTNPSIFDHCDLKNMQVEVSSSYYPEVLYDFSIPNNEFSLAYGEASEFSEKYYGMNDLITSCNILPNEYRDLYPLMVFDISKQRGSLNDSTIRIKVNASFNTAPPANTVAYALIKLDKILRFKSEVNFLIIKF